MKHPTVILHTNAPDEAVTIVAAQHPDLPLHGCDSYEALPGLIAETGAEVIYSVRFQGGGRAIPLPPPCPRPSNGCRSAARAWIISGSGIRRPSP